MILTPHMLVGAAIGSHVSNLWLAFCFGLASHYLLDILPHWDYLLKVEFSNLNNVKKVATDLIFGIILILILTWSMPNKIIILAAVVASILPDFINGIYSNYKVQWLKYLVQFHHKIHIYVGLSFRQGMPATIIVSLAAILVLIL
ncbi:MAG: hypothetical protein ABIF84_01560 [Patescibacteria group bacterium]